MADGFERTPDARVTHYTEASSDAQWQADEPRLRVLGPFVEACLSVVPDPPLGGGARLGLLLFFLGAADRLWRRLRLDDRRFPGFAESLLRRHGLTAAESATLAQALPQVRENPEARKTLLEGAEALDIWLDGHDSNVVLRVTEAIARWRTMPRLTVGEWSASPD